MLYPAPSVMVSCKLGDNRPNIITIAWAGTICSDPPMVSISVRPERYSYDMIRKSGEFVINLVTKDLVRACDYCGVRSGKDHDKFKENGLTEYYSEFIDAPAINESPVNIYCKTDRIVNLGTHDMFIATVCGITVDERYMDGDGRFDLAATDLVSYIHGEYYDQGEKLGKFGYSVQKKSKTKYIE